jgi:transcriptional regulator with XRE-family HTH domain
MQTFGEKLKQLRKRAGFTPEELAARAGVNVVSIYAWERGATAPLLSSTQRLAKALGVSISAFEGVACSTKEPEPKRLACVNGDRLRNEPRS